MGGRRGVDDAQRRAPRRAGAAARGTTPVRRHHLPRTCPAGLTGRQRPNTIGPGPPDTRPHGARRGPSPSPVRTTLPAIVFTSVRHPCPHSVHRRTPSRRRPPRRTAGPQPHRPRPDAPQTGGTHIHSSADPQTRLLCFLAQRLCPPQLDVFAFRGREHAYRKRSLSGSTAPDDKTAANALRARPQSEGVLM